MRVLILLIAALAIASPAAAQIKVISETKPATMLRTDELVLRSEAIGRDFVVEITYPAAPIPPGQKFPAVYAVDGGFGVAGSMARMMIGGGRMAPAFVVSIGYGNLEGRYIGPRNTDLMHKRLVQNGREYGGGGRAFEDFIVKELRPLLEQRYPLDPARTILAGHSGGANFASTILVERPETFSAYVIGSLPIIGFDEDIAERAKAMASKGGGRRVYLAYSQTDKDVLASDRFGTAISGAGSTFRVLQEFYPDETHSSAYLPLITRGLPYVLPMPNMERAAITVRPEVLDRYVGVYRLTDGRTVTIRREDGRFTGQLATNAPLDLFADTELRFFPRAVDAEITFAPGAKAPSLMLKNNGVDIQGVRVP